MPLSFFEWHFLYLCVNYNIMSYMKRLLSILIVGALAFACTAPAQPEQKPQGQNNQNPGNNTNPGDETNPGDDTNPGTVEPDFSDPDWYNTFFWDRTDRQKAGIRGPVKSIHRSTPQYVDDRYNIFTFDEAGHLIKNEYRQINTDEYNHSATYTYDDAGRRVRMDFKVNDRTYGYTCEYNNGDRYVAVNGSNWIHMYGVLLEQSGGYADCEDLVGIVKGLSKVHFERADEGFWVNIRDYEYVFDDDGNLTITCTQFSGQDSNNLSKHVDISYVTYKDGLPCHSSYSTDLGTSEIDVEWQPNGLPAKWVDAGGETYEYAQNSRTVLIQKHYGYIDWGGMRGQEYFYDNHFDLVKSSLDIGDEQFGLHYNDFTDYTYDKYGNWTSRKEAITPLFWDGTENGRSIETVYNEIEYFE